MLGDQQFDPLSEQFFAPITEKLLCLGVDQDDLPLAVDNDQAIRSKLKEAAEDALGFGHEST